MVIQSISKQANVRSSMSKIDQPQQKYLFPVTDLGEPTHDLRGNRSHQALIDDVAHLQQIIEEQEINYRYLKALNQKLQTSAQEMQTARDLALAIVEVISLPMLVLDGQLQVVSANRAFYRLFGGLPIEVEGQSFTKLGNGQWRLPKLRAYLEDLLLNNTEFPDLEVAYNFDRIGLKTMLVNARQIADFGHNRSIDPQTKPKILIQIVEIADCK